jgi:hypothetical protein
MATDNVSAIQAPDGPVTEDELVKLIDLLDHGLSILFVSQAALDNGETDLELQSSTALAKAHEAIEEAYDELLGMRLRVGRLEAAHG